MNEIWQAVILGIIIGGVGGYLISRLTTSGVKKQAETEQELQQLRSQVETQKQQLETHFSQSADLLKNLAEDYKKLYLHLANSSTELLPELAEKPIFSKNLLTVESESIKENAEQAETVLSTSESEITSEKDENLVETSQETSVEQVTDVKGTVAENQTMEEKTAENEPPKDYSEGSSGLLKSDKEK